MTNKRLTFDIRRNDYVSEWLLLERDADVENGEINASGECITVRAILTIARIWHPLRSSDWLSCTAPSLQFSYFPSVDILSLYAIVLFKTCSYFTYKASLVHRSNVFVLASAFLDCEMLFVLGLQVACVFSTIYNLQYLVQGVENNHFIL